tara:strand:- start:201 stop:533 length:333 start_codon:yes stop_codon:yes gene_type:complete
MAKPWFADRKGTRVAVNITSATTTAVVAASGTVKYRLLRYSLTAGAAGAGTFQFKSNTTAITGIRNIPNDGALGEVFTGGEDCTAGEALNLITTGTAPDLDGDVWYETVE